MLFPDRGPPSSGALLCRWSGVNVFDRQRSRRSTGQGLDQRLMPAPPMRSCGGRGQSRGIDLVPPRISGRFGSVAWNLLGSALRPFRRANHSANPIRAPNVIIPGRKSMTFQRVYVSPSAPNCSLNSSTTNCWSSEQSACHDLERWAAAAAEATRRDLV